MFKTQYLSVQYLKNFRDYIYLTIKKNKIKDMNEIVNSLKDDKEKAQLKQAQSDDYINSLKMELENKNIQIKHLESVIRFVLSA